MKTILSGPVTAAHLEDADLMAGITPTLFLSNGLYHPPVEVGARIPTEVRPIDPMLGELGERQRNMSLLAHADALVAVGPGFEMQIASARKMGVLVYEVAK